MSRPADGSASIDLMVWMTLWVVLSLTVLGLVRSPVVAARISYAVDSAAEAAARERSVPEAVAAATEELDRNLTGPDNPRLCLTTALDVDAHGLSAQLGEAGGPPQPGHVDVRLTCTISARTLAGIPVNVTIAVDARARHVADVYRRTE